MNEIHPIYTDDLVFENNKYSVWSKAVTSNGYYNYGYPTLSAGPFADVAYLKNDTGNNINNARMLNSINSIGLEKDYTL